MERAQSPDLVHGGAEAGTRFSRVIEKAGVKTGKMKQKSSGSEGSGTEGTGDRKRHIEITISRHIEDEDSEEDDPEEDHDYKAGFLKATVNRPFGTLSEKRTAELRAAEAKRRGPVLKPASEASSSEARNRKSVLSRFFGSQGG